MPKTPIPDPAVPDLEAKLKFIRDRMQEQERLSVDIEQNYKQAISDSHFGHTGGGIAEALQGIADGTIGILPSVGPFKLLKPIYEFARGAVDFANREKTYDVDGVGKMLGDVGGGSPKLLFQIHGVIDKGLEGDQLGANADLFGVLGSISKLKGLDKLGTSFGNVSDVIGGAKDLWDGADTVQRGSIFREEIGEEMRDVLNRIGRSREKLGQQEIGVLQQMRQSGAPDPDGEDWRRLKGRAPRQGQDHLIPEVSEVSGAGLRIYGEIDLSDELNPMRMNVERLRAHTAVASPRSPMANSEPAIYPAGVIPFQEYSDGGVHSRDLERIPIPRIDNPDPLFRRDPAEMRLSDEEKGSEK